MKIIEIAPLNNGAHNNQIIHIVNPSTFPIPDGWAIIPDDMICENFPFGSFETEIIHGLEYVKSGSWIPGVIPEPVISTEEQIISLKAELSATDYKIIKCSEAQLIGEELPYDVFTLHAERQAIRDQINQLEEEM